MCVQLARMASLGVWMLFGYVLRRCISVFCCFLNSVESKITQVPAGSLVRFECEVQKANFFGE